MTNQQLIDFIKQQLQLGLTKEKITSELLANGWNNQDIEEGFKATGVPIPPAPVPTLTPNPATFPTLNPTPVTTQNLNPNLYPNFNNNNLVSIKEKKQSGKWLFFVILILLLAGGASAYYFKDDLVNFPIIKNLFSNKNTTVVQDVSTQTDETQALTQTEQSDTNSLSIYNDPDGLYSFSYPKNWKVNFLDIPQALNTYVQIDTASITPETDSNLILIVVDMNNEGSGFFTKVINIIRKILLV